MKFSILTTTATAAVIATGLVSFAQAGDENHEIIEKVMKEGLKNDDSPWVKIKDGAGTPADFKSLYELGRTLRGTKAPVGEQAGYDEKVEALIAAAGAVTYAGQSPERLEALKTAVNCKACHSDHKPKD